MPTVALYIELASSISLCGHLSNSALAIHSRKQVDLFIVPQKPQNVCTNSSETPLAHPVPPGYRETLGGRREEASSAQD